MEEKQKIYLRTNKETEDFALMLIRVGKTVRIGKDEKKDKSRASTYFVEFWE